MKENEDDGSLAFLKINVTDETRYFNCETITMQRLLNKRVLVMDIVDGVSTKHGDSRMVVKIKKNENDLESDALKFFTNSMEMKLILNKVKEMGKLPRWVTVRAIGNRYFLE